ncbi:MAG: CHAP domain-containing protein [Bacteroidota bacterium]
MTKAQAGAKIIEVASRFLGLYETKANAEWEGVDPLLAADTAEMLRRELAASGWLPNWAYCAAFCEMVWRLAYTELGAPKALFDDILPKMTPGVMLTMENFRKRVVRAPAPGAVAFWQKGISSRGHAGIVVRVHGDRKNMSCIEANTSADSEASDERQRDGEGIYRKVRKLDFEQKPSLWLRGFLHPLEF